MALVTADRWTLNRLSWPTGIVTVTILRNRRDFDLIGGGTWLTGKFGSGFTANAVEFAQTCRFLKSVGPELTKTLNLESADITPPTLDFEFNDLWQIEGRMTIGGGVPVDIPLSAEDGDCYTAGRTVGTHIFNDLDAVYTVYVVIDKSDGSGSECVFIGEINAREITSEGGDVHFPMTSSERVRMPMKCTATSIAGILQKVTVGDFIGYITNQGGASQITSGRPFYCGFSAFAADRFKMKTIETIHTSSDWQSQYIDICGGSQSALVGIMVAGHRNINEQRSSGHYDDVVPPYTDVFPKGSYGIKVWNVFRIIAQMLDFSTFASSDFVPAFTAYANKWDHVGAHYEDDLIAAENIELNYNYVFGLSPHDGSEMASPISFTWKTSLSEVVKRLAIDWGCYIWPTIDTDNMSMGFEIVGRNRNAGTIPSAWQKHFGPSFKEEPVAVGKQSVVITNAGSKAGVRAWMGSRPVDEGNAIKIETKLRARRWGNTSAPVFKPINVLHGDFDSRESPRAFVRYSETEENHVNPDSWIGVNCYAYFNSSTGTNYGYPNGGGNKLWTGPLGSDGSGFYQLSVVTDEAGVFTDRSNMLLAHALLYASEFLGNRTVKVREFPSARDDSGSFNGIGPGLRATILTARGVKTYRAIETKQNLKYDTCEVKFADVADCRDRISYEFFDGEGSTSGSGGGSSSEKITTDSPVESGRIIAAKYVAETYATLKTDYTYGTIQLVVDNAADAKKNGLWYVDSNGTITRYNVHLKYGASVICRHSESNHYGLDSLWTLYDTLSDQTPYGDPETVIPPDGTIEQHWLNQNAPRKILTNDPTNGIQYHEKILTGAGLIVETESDGADGLTISPIEGIDATGKRLQGFRINPNPLCSYVVHLHHSSPPTLTLTANVWSDLAVDTDDYCAAKMSDGISSLNPLQFQPTTPGYFDSAMLIKGTLPVNWPISELEMRLAFYTGSGWLYYPVDMRIFNYADSHMFFVGGTCQPVRYDGSACYAKVQIRYLNGAVPSLVLTPTDVHFSAHWCGDCPDCAP